VNRSNQIKLGNASIDTVITAGKLKLGTITYPNTAGTNGYVLTTNGSGSASWTSPLLLAYNELKINSLLTGNLTMTSDRRLKSDIKSIPTTIDIIKKLNPVSYKKKDSLESTQYKHEEMGFIAQEIQKVLPMVVKEGSDKDKLLSVNYISLIPVLTKAIQEQQSQIEEQKKTMQQQQKQIDELKKLIEQVLSKK
jgi:hypothetical protein